MNNELNHSKLTGLPVDTYRWNIEDLQSYVGAMQAEVERVEKLISEKQSTVSCKCFVCFQH